MTYIFPRIKFASTNTLHQQLQHVMSESDEIFEEMLNIPLKHDRLAEELVDQMHSCETALRIMQEKYCIPVYRVIEKVIQKNRERGYYD